LISLGWQTYIVYSKKWRPIGKKLEKKMCSLLQDDQRSRGGRGGMQRDRWGDIYANTPTKKMIALYDYDPLELSPNVDSEVSI